MPKRIRPIGIRRRLSYTIEQAADALGVHPQTIRGWRKSGLHVMQSKRPHLVYGGDLLDFLSDRQLRTRTKLGVNEFYCLKCRRAVIPAGSMADFEYQEGSTGRLVGLCPNCETAIYRFVNVSKIRDTAPALELAFTTPPVGLSGSATAPSKTHLAGDRYDGETKRRKRTR